MGGDSAWYELLELVRTSTENQDEIQNSAFFRRISRFCCFWCETTRVYGSTRCDTPKPEFYLYHSTGTTFSFVQITNYQTDSERSTAAAKTVVSEFGIESRSCRCLRAYAAPMPSPGSFWRRLPRLMCTIIISKSNYLSKKYKLPNY